MARTFRPSRIPDLLLLVGCLLSLPPRDARGEAEMVATRLAPSSLSARYGPVTPVRRDPVGGLYLAPTRTGMEVRSSDAIGDSLLGTFRTAGTVSEVAWSGATAYLIAGERGIVAVDVSQPAAPVAIGSHDHLGVLLHGAFAPGSGTLAVAGDQTLSFLHEVAPGDLSLMQTRVYTDGRRILRVQARSDSFLVLSLRSAPTFRMGITLYRVQTGAAPESLWEFQANGFQAQDLAWPDAMAFVAVGNDGVLPFNTVTRAAGAAVSINVASFVRAVAADSASVVAVGQARTYAQLTRTGPSGGTLTGEVDRLAALDPFFVSLVGGLAVISENESGAPIEPDESGTSALEIRDVSQPAQPGRTSMTGSGRVRRVLHDGGLAYVADYTGGLRIYRAASADTSLVGSLTLAGSARVYDLALDRSRHVLYLAAGTGGVVLVDVADPGAPAVVASLALPGLTATVAAIDTTLAAAGRRGSAGITFLNVVNPTAPVPRGSVDFPFILDPRGLAARDTVLFVADAIQGLVSVSFRNPDAPVTIGVPSGMAAHDVDLEGTRLLVGTTADGVQVVDATDPGALSLLGTLATPPVFGVTQQGQTGIALLGDGGALAIDLRQPNAPRVRGPIAVPGFARDAAWVGDTLLIAASYALERYAADATVTAEATLSLSVDAQAVVPRVQVVWFASLPPGAIGWNVYRDFGAAGQGQASAAGTRVNDTLLAPAVRAAVDAGVQAGNTYRYRLDAFFPDGSSLEVAEGAIFVGSNSALGRVYPNPYRPRNGQLLLIPYRVLSVDEGKSIELRVFDVRGRLVRRIRSVIAAGGGFGSLSWDGRDDRGRAVADGVYFVNVNGPGIDDARQLILLR